MLEAYVRELDGESALAADAYLRAFRAGERRPGVVERLVGLLVGQGRLDDADEVIRKFQQRQAPPAGLARLGAEIALRQHHAERAAELARLAVPADSNDYPKLIWLGQTLALAGQPTEAEEALRQAVRRRDDLAETWIALVAHLARAEQRAEAEDVREQMRRRLPPDQMPLALAVCAETLGQRDVAGEHYSRALAQTPEDGLVLQRAAQFHLRLNQPARAEPLLRRMIASEANVAAGNQAWARRQLALLLAFGPSPQPSPPSGGEGRVRGGYDRALALLDDHSRPEKDTVFGRRARLLVHATRAGERSAALRQLEESGRIEPFTSEELLRLVQLYEMDGNEDAAHEKMLDLLGLDRDNPEYLAHHIDRLRRRGRNDEARPWIVRLHKLTANGRRQPAG